MASLGDSDDQVDRDLMVYRHACPLESLTFLSVYRQSYNPRRAVPQVRTII